MHIIICVMLACFSAFADSDLRMARKADRALDTLFKVSIHQLKVKGHKDTAQEIERGWKRHNGSVYRIVVYGKRDIGDFEPLSKFLADAYDKIEAKLGVQLCYSLRISDIKTLNYTIPVVFNPCSVDENEYFMHFVHDDTYRGFAPVVAYWGSMVVCIGATYGAGALAICSPIAMAIEFAVDSRIAPAVAPRIYERKCG